jgi:hypothetical protein
MKYPQVMRTSLASPLNARSAGKDADKKNGQDTAAMLPLDADENRRYKAVKSGDDQSRAWFS